MALNVPSIQQALHTESRTCMSNARHKSGANVSVKYLLPGGTITWKDARSRAEEPKIPDPIIFSTGLTSENGDPLIDLPSIGDCAAHLTLLEAFYTLRIRVLNSERLDDAFGIEPHPEKGQMYSYKQRRMIESTRKDRTFATRRRDKWPIFLQLAVCRFHVWIQQEVARTSSNSRFAPPLDILLVWHTLLLNSKTFDEYCGRSGLEQLATMSLPWKTIVESIDTSNWHYSLPLDKKKQFVSTYALHWDFLDYLENTSKPYELDKFLSKLGPAYHVSNGVVPGSQTKESLALKMSYPLNSDHAFARMLSKPPVSSKDISSLVSAIERQGHFVEKMHRNLWIRSPAIEGTLRRSILRYEKFLRLFKLYPSQTLVPTLDIDLAWHTHQCTPTEYRTSSKVIAGRIIGHDDTIGKTALDNGMERTSNYFRIRFAEEYEICTCWDCEAILSATTSGNKKLTPSMGVDTNETLDTVRFENIANKALDEVAYHRAVELARRQGKMLPVLEN